MVTTPIDVADPSEWRGHEQRQHLYRHMLTRMLVIGILAIATVATALPLRAEDKPILLLSMKDPFARAYSQNREKVHDTLGVNLNVELLDYESVNRALAVNSLRKQSDYDLVAVDIVWVSDYASHGALLPLQLLVSDHRVDGSDFIDLAWEGGQFDGKQFALPIQPHPEVLIYRLSVLRRLNLKPPKTTDDVIEIARRVEEEIPNMHGICWNAASGAALGQQMLHFAAAFGAPVLRPDGSFTVSDPGWVKAFEYAKTLATLSPPQISEMAWDVRMAHFGMGSCAMTYAWGAAIAGLEEVGSTIAGDIGYAAAPHAPGYSPVTPLGSWLLAIPANLAPDRIPAALDALLRLTSADGARLLLELGVSASPRRSQTLGASRSYSILKLVDELDHSGELATWMRPAVQGFQGLSEIIGVEAHAALFDGVPVSTALARINGRVNDQGEVP
ncbi:MAG: extracellular solute-binding protein [Rhodospirillaceae bacterium]|nr:extracellular solute-binding protein [Rhodospirillaceae bacterium]